MRKSKFSLLILLLVLLCFSPSQGATQHKQVRNRVSERQPYQYGIQPSEDSQGFVQLRFFDDETDEDEEMIRKALELKREQQQQWCQANKHFKEQQWFSEALEQASRCINWEDLAQENGNQQQQFQFFLLEKQKDLKHNNRGDRNGAHQYEKLPQQEEKHFGKYLKHSVIQKSVKKNEAVVSRKETASMKLGNNNDDADGEYKQQHKEVEDNQEEIEEKEESNINEEEQEQEIKSRETGHSADNLKLLNTSKDIQEDQFNSQEFDQGEQDTSTQSNDIQCTQKQNKNYCSQVKCIQNEMTDSFIKEDFLKVLSCLNEGRISYDSFRHNSQNMDILYEHCLRDGSAVFSQKQKYLAHKVHLQVRHCNKRANSNYFRCLAEIQNAEESKLAREGDDCVEKYTLIHDDILPSCQKQFLTRLDTKHEQFQELCDLKCGKLYESFFAPLILEQPEQKYKELETCIKDIYGNDEGLIEEAINVITCVKDKQLALQDSFKQK